MAEQWRILVVEDEESLNWSIVNSLQKDGYIVRGVTSGAETIRLLWSEEYDVVICNQKMPDADGFELLQWIRTYCPNTRMVLIAPPGSSVARTQALEGGVVSYLEKPLDLHLLKEELRRLLYHTGFSASLDSFDLLDVIQIITMSRKSIALVVSTGLEEQGILRFQNGELIWAEYGTLRGEEAFFALAAHKNGTVVHRPWNEQIIPNVTQPLSRLIFQALQYRSKYADFQQLSGELEMVIPGVAPLTSPISLPFLSQSVEEDEDRPFVFVAETETRSDTQTTDTGFEQFRAGSSTHTAFEYVTGASPIGIARTQAIDTSLHSASTLEQAAGMAEMSERVENTNNVAGQSSQTSETREWWEKTGSYPRADVTKITEQKGRKFSSGALKYPSVTRPLHQPIGEEEAAHDGNTTPSQVRKTMANQRPDLPSWLIEQPTQFDLPVLREGTGQLPATPGVTAHEVQQLQPAPLISTRPSPAEWQSPPPPTQPPPAKPTDVQLRKPTPEQAIYGQITGSHRPVVPNLPGKAGSSTSTRKASSTEWPGPGTINAGLPEMSGYQTGALQSLASLKRPATPSAEAQKKKDVPANNGADHSQIQTHKRNYSALAAALQTLGYSVPGFVASAVVGLDGQPIAQVAVDDLDISPLCEYFGSILRGAFLSLEQGNWGTYEDTIITSGTQHILLRLIDSEQEVFQVLITTRETRPAESLEAMANVEAAIASALQ